MKDLSLTSLKICHYQSFFAGYLNKETPQSQSIKNKIMYDVFLFDVIYTD